MQTDEHFLTVARYVERNALRAKLVARAEDWQWGNLWRRVQGDSILPNAECLARGAAGNWLALVNQPQTAAELEALWCNVQRGRPFGGEHWVAWIAK